MEQEIAAPRTSPALWDERYSSYVTVYGDEPNAFFKEHISKLPKGKLLLPAEGEGRNAVFAATLGWNVDAFDYSEAARNKAMARALEKNVHLHYTTGDISEIILPSETYDAVGLIYFHLPPERRRDFHRRIVQALKKGGHLILEAFSKEQIKNISGGPKDPQLLYDRKELINDLEGLTLNLAVEERVRLNEGPFHQGKADVIRILATKPL